MQHYREKIYLNSQILDNSHADVNLQDSEGNTALDIAKENNSAEIVNLLTR